MNFSKKYLSYFACLALAMFFNLGKIFSQINMMSGATTRAVVVGISKYQNSEIPSLQYAHRDAEAFADFLKSPGGGQVSPQNIRLLTNEKATNSQFASALMWLVGESKEGDLAIIYFSGHGDVETLTIDQLAYLLPFDSPPVAYAAGAFPVSYLQSIVSTLSIKNKAKVVLITDACHAGKLAGSMVKGSQATASNLSRQFANEVKILSCQPDEYSNESSRWGGGRGVFSWYLVNGLYGLADQNSDLVVNLQEIGRFLEDKVPADVAPGNQTPMFFGSRGEVLASVDGSTLAAVKQQISSSQGGAMGYVTKDNQKSGNKKDTLILPTAAKATLLEMEKALHKGFLMEPRGGSACDFYKKMQEQAPNHPLTARAGLDLAAELGQRGQRIFNDAIMFQTGKPLAMTEDFRVKIQQAKTFFEKTALILGDKNFQIKTLQAKMVFLEGLLAVDNYKKNKNTIDPQSLIQKAELMLAESPGTSYLHVLIGELYTWGLNDPQRGLNYFARARVLSPNWEAVYSGITMATERLNKNMKPDELDERVGSNGEKDELAAQTLTADRLLFSGDAAAAVIYQKIGKQFPNEPVAKANAALALALQGNYDEAEEKLLNLRNTAAKEPRVFSNLVHLYLMLDSPTQAEDFGKRATEKFPNDPAAKYDWARILAAQGKKTEATAAVLDAFENGYPFPERLKIDTAFEKLRRDAAFKNAVSGYVHF